jgi:hypothetical protein
MHMTWHHFHFDQARLGFVARVLDQFLQTDVYRRHENRAPVFRAEHHIGICTKTAHSGSI